MKLTVSLDCCKGKFCADIFKADPAENGPVPVTVILPGPSVAHLDFYPKTGVCAVSSMPFDYDGGAPEDIMGTVSFKHS